LARAPRTYGYFGSISLGVLTAVMRSTVGDLRSQRPAMTVLAVIILLSFAAIYTDFVAYRIRAPLTAIDTIFLS
jgi:hypothetical protein